MRLEPAKEFPSGMPSKWKWKRCWRRSVVDHAREPRCELGRDLVDELRVVIEAERSSLASMRAPPEKELSPWKKMLSW